MATSPIKRLCVYCGSSMGSLPSYRDAATALGGLLARRGIELVYGGGHVGLMGAVADGTLAAGGHVIGVIPRALMDRELGHAGIQELRIVADMHERKTMMAELADAFIAMPGGWGTIEELSEMLTWLQLGIHAKQIGLLNVDGYYDPLIAFAERMIDQRFVRAEHRSLMTVDADPEALLTRLMTPRVAPLDKWFDYTPAPRA
ncbi:MAG: TIGR00730 family Rossman fold protein [Burkholderiaceae bacterium]